MTPERWNHVRELTEECRPLLATAEGMDAVQHFLGQRRVWVLDAILVTRELLGAGPHSLAEAKTIVLSSAARRPEVQAHDQVVAAVELRAANEEPRR
ncbi:hypothetical protein MTF65_28050 [Streptomyces sp. APSN-46.1]|uniref:hypothetical protein n=1 Tax=Streptomyces sp. APSN-46.1 TaxID=2929049 RepID=UPI001FB50C51|nr:hypothetical protein [Streptomyces sp. APSN-46.1]MCJ1681137.1 hypothetical protein [Streptomyces sp. APSN-46.1]